MNRSVLGFTLCSLALTACHGPTSGGQLLQSSKPRLDVGTEVTPDIRQQASDNADFAFALYAQLATQEGNLFYSPYSISSALAMTWAGARSTTATEMATALRWSLPDTRLHAAFNGLDTQLAERGADHSAQSQGSFQLHVVNALWPQRGLDVQAPFLDTLAENYGAGVRTLDFAANPEPARLDINTWVAEQTKNLIPELLPSGSISRDTRFVLTNAVYFDAAWLHKFDRKDTQPGDFHGVDGTTRTVDMMHQSVEATYGEGADWEAVDLDYIDPQLALTLIVPRAGKLAAVEAALSGAFWRDLVRGEELAQVTLALPRFHAETHLSVRDQLSALGMPSAFDGNSADFSGIDGKRDLHLSDVIHQATVTVDEDGTVAAAATAVLGAGAAAPQKSVTLTIDRPFLLALRDKPTGAVLFVGRIVNP